MAEQDVRRYEEALRRLNQAGKEAYRTLTELQERVRTGRGTTLGGDTVELEKQRAAVRQLADAYKRLRESAQQARSSGASTTAPSGSTPDIRNFMPIQSRYQQEEQKQQGESKKATEASKASRIFSEQRAREINAHNRALKAEYARQLNAAKREAAAKERQAQEEERESKRLSSLREKIATDPRYAQYRRQLQSAGLSPYDVTGLENRGGGIERLTASRDSGGVRQRFTGFVDQYGKSTPGVTGQYRSFGQGIIKDIGELTKWSIALAVIYGPLNKLQQLVGDMIENESRLADAVIAVNTSMLDQGEIFDISADAAKRSGEAVTGVIDAFTQAYRAAGRYTDQGQRQAQATQLLGDSLVLSKISTLDQAEAIDTLTAALLQNEMELGEGEQLLNKWVKVSQTAYVGIDTLATGVAVLGDAAETVGLDIDELNGLIAVLAETSISGSKEAANTAKALVGAYQSAEAEKELGRFGIALRKTNGEVRDFLDIYGELSKLRAEGILGEADISEISLALGGGGVRRAKDASALINNVVRLKDIAAQSRSVTGDSTLAQDALAEKLDTVQTATTRVENAFQSLAQTLGTDGGVLDLIKLLANGLGLIVESADALFSILGKSGPALTAFAAAAVPLALKGTTGRAALIRGFGERAYKRAVSRFPTPQFGGGYAGFAATQLAQEGAALAGGRARTRAESIVGRLIRPGLGVGLAYGVLGAGLPALGNLQQGRTDQAIGNIAGGAIGAAIGNALGGPIGLAAGATIGSAIAEAFVNATEIKAEAFLKLFEGVIDKETGRGENDTEDDIRRNQLREVYRTIGGGNVLAGQIASVVEQLVSRLPEGTKEKLGDLPEGARYATAQSAAYGILQRQNPELYDLLEARNPNRVLSENDPLQRKAAEKRINDLRDLANQERQVQLQRTVTGEITPSEYKRISEDLSGYAASAYQNIESFGDAFIALNDDINSTEDAYKAFLTTVVYGSQEQIDYIASIRADLQALKGLQDNWDALVAPEEEGRVINIAGQPVTYGAGGRNEQQLAQDIQNLTNQWASLLSVGFQQAQLNQLEVPGIVGAGDPRSRQQFNQDKRRAQELQDEFYQGFLEIPDDMYDALKESWEDFAVAIEDSGDNFYEKVSGIEQRFFQQAEKERTGGGAFRVQQIDLPSSERDRLQSWITYYDRWLENQFGGKYKLNEEDLGVVFNDNVTDILHGDNLSIKLALEKLIDVNQKQLDGIYNLPEGATAFLPYELFQNVSRAGEGVGGGTSDRLTGGLVFSEGDRLKSKDDMLEEQRNRYFDLLEKDRETIDRSGMYDERRGRGYNRNLTALEAESFDKSKLNYKGFSYGKGPGPYGYGTPAIDVQGILQSIRDFIQSIPGIDSRDGQAPLTPEMQVPEVKSNLDISFDSTVQLMVDGRVLASVVKTYLASELLQSQQTQSTVTRRYVV